MNNYVKSEKGNTLLIVLGFIIVVALIITPLALRTTSGLLQTKSGGFKEAAYSDAYSAMTLFARMHEEVKSDTEAAFGGLSSQDEWIALLDGQVSERVLAKYPNVHIERHGEGEQSEWTFTAKKGPSVLSYDNAGAYFRTGQVVYSLKEGISSPLPTVPPDTGDNGGDDDEDEGGNPSFPSGGFIMLKAVDSLGRPLYNKMFAACKTQVNQTNVSVQSKKWILPEENYFNNDYTAAEFDSVFKDMLDHYTDLNGMIDKFPFYKGSNIGRNDPRLDLSPGISVNGNSSVRNVPVQNWTPVWDNDVTVNANHGNLGSNVTFSFTEPVVVAGNLSFTPGLNTDKKVTVTSETGLSGPGTLVGGNLSISRMNDRAKLEFDHNVYVKGNFTSSGGSSDSQTIIKGDLVVNGNFVLDAGNSDRVVFRVEGDLLVGGNIEIRNVGNSVKIEIGKSMQAGGNISIDPHSGFSVGGDLLGGGSVVLTRYMNGNNTISIGGSFAAGGNIIVNAMNNANGKIAIGNHLLAGGSIELAKGNTMNGQITVGATIAAKGDIAVSTTINSSGVLAVKDQIISGGNFDMVGGSSQNMDGKLLMENGNLIVFGNARFGHINGSKYDRMVMNGIAVKGYVDFSPNNYTHVNNAFLNYTGGNQSSHDAAICLTGVDVP